MKYKKYNSKLIIGLVLMVLGVGVFLALSAISDERTMIDKCAFEQVCSDTMTDTQLNQAMIVKMKKVLDNNNLMIK